jgi:hypothetical protein
MVGNVLVKHDVEAEPKGEDEEGVPGEEEDEATHHLVEHRHVDVVAKTYRTLLFSLPIEVRNTCGTLLNRYEKSSTYCQSEELPQYPADEFLDVTCTKFFLAIHSHLY